MTPDPPLAMLKPDPVALTPEIETFELPVLVRLKLCDAVDPSVTEPKLRLPGLTLSVYVAATPVPLSETADGEFGALLTTVTEPLTAPAEVGAYCTLKVLVAPGASVSGTVTPPTVKPEPVAEICEMLKLAVPLFFS